MRFEEYYLIESLGFENYFDQITNGNFIRINNKIWSNIKEDGFDEEMDDNNKENYSYIVLNIPIEDQDGLKNYNNDIIDKWNEFDIMLKEKKKLYDKGYLDMIDYDNGKIYIIKHEFISGK